MFSSVNRDNILLGTIDTHVHCGPDPVFEHRYDAFETAKLAEESGMRAIVLKNHSYPTAVVASLVKKQVEKIDVFGGICLNWEVGGVNPEAVYACAKIGGKVVWMPTFSADHCLKRLGRDQERGISILDDSGNLRPEVLDVLRIVKEHGLILESGHLSPAEIYLLAKEAFKMGIEKVLITHPCAVKVGPALSLTQQKELSEMGCYMEHLFYLYDAHE